MTVHSGTVPLSANAAVTSRARRAHFPPALQGLCCRAGDERPRCARRPAPMRSAENSSARRSRAPKDQKLDPSLWGAVLGGYALRGTCCCCNFDRLGEQSTSRWLGPALAQAAGVVMTVLAVSRECLGATCPASTRGPTTPERAPALREARQLAYGKHYADARALYLWLWARDKADDEAAAGLAQIDAWEGCWALAEHEYRELIAAHPEDPELWGGLVDLLMWQRRWSEARAILRTVPGANSIPVPLLLRRARLLQWEGDDMGALEAVRRVEALEPNDSDVRDLGDEIFMGRGALGARLDLFPAGYPNIQTYDASFMQRWRKFAFEFQSRLVDWNGGSLSKALVDTEDSITVTYHPTMGVSASVGVGLGVRGVLLPSSEFKAAVSLPIWWRFQGALDYSYWTFTGGTGVHIINPTLSYEVTDSIEVAAHAWIVHVAFGSSGPGGFVGTVGGHAGWKPLHRLKLSLDYTYGAQLAHDPTATQLLSLRSHTVTLAADWQLTREYGLIGLLSEERRASDAPTIFIESMGASFYTRW